MALVTTENFDGGTVGAAVDSSTSIFTTSFGTPVVHSDTHAVSGTLSMLVDTTSSAGMIGTQYAAAITVTYWRFYVYLDAIPAGNAYMMAMHASGSKTMDLRVGSTGTVTVRDGNVAAWTSTSALTAGEWHRIEGMCDSTAGNQRVRLFHGANIHGATPDEQSPLVAYSGAAITNGTIGATASSTVKFWVDDYAVDDATWVGPSQAPPATPSNVFARVGGAWVPVVPHARVGGTWVPASATPSP